MTTKLKNLRVTKVDFVDEGANQRADVKLYKRKEGEENPAIQQQMKKSSVFKKLAVDIGKVLGFKDEEMEVFQEDMQVQKGDCQSFHEKITEAQRGKIADEMWNVCYALQSSLQSILFDGNLKADTVRSMMEQSVSEFYEMVTESVKDWADGRSCGINKSVDGSGMEAMKKYRDKLDAEVKEALKKQRGEWEHMLKVDRTKMTAEERAAYDALIKKYGVEEEEESSVKLHEKEEEQEEEEAKKGCRTGKEPTKKSVSGEEDIYKGLHPAVKAELEALNKFKADAEEREIAQVAKKYEIIGKKKEELVPLLKSLKEAGGTAYTDMIGVLDAAVSLAESGGAFEEIGKSGQGRRGFSIAKSNSEAKIESIAKGLMEKDPGLSYADAVAKAWENNSDLMAEYEEEAGF